MCILLFSQRICSASYSTSYSTSYSRSYSSARGYSLQDTLQVTLLAMQDYALCVISSAHPKRHSIRRTLFEGGSNSPLWRANVDLTGLVTRAIYFTDRECALTVTFSSISSLQALNRLRPTTITNPTASEALFSKEVATLFSTSNLVAHLHTRGIQ